MNHHRKCNHGLTVIEAIVVVSVVAVMSMTLMSIFITNVRLNNLLRVKAELQNQSSLLHLHLQEQIHLATRILDSATVFSVAYTSDEETLILEIPAVDGNGHLIPDVYDLVVFSLDPNDTSRLLFNRDANASSARSDLSDKLIASNIDDLAFIYNDVTPSSARNVFFRAEFVDAIYGRTQTVEYVTYLELKNYEE